MRIRISWPRGQVTAELAPGATANKLQAALPFDAVANTWGDEVYFETPVDAALESGAKQVVAPGTVCYWPPGRALALPFGPTPVSRAGECRLASPCTVLGSLTVDADQLRSVQDGDTVHVAVLPEEN